MARDAKRRRLSARRRARLGGKARQRLGGKPPPEPSSPAPETAPTEEAPEPALPAIEAPDAVPEAEQEPEAQAPEPAETPPRLAAGALARRRRAAPRAAHHEHLSREQLLAMRRRERVRLAVYAVVGALLGIGLVVGILAIASRFTVGMAPVRVRPLPDSAVAAKPEPPPDPREAWAVRRFRDAQRTAAEGLWLTAESHLNRLRREYSKTKFYAEHEAAIGALWAKVRAALDGPPPKQQK